MAPATALHAAWNVVRLRDLAVRAARCPFCGPTLLLRLRAVEFGIRCARCGASAVHLALGQVLRIEVPDISASDVCELSARGPLARYLLAHARSTALSEYFESTAPGSVRNGVRCEDVQRLTYADSSFDLVTHTEVFEHVADDAAAFGELHRVLRPAGKTIFTVPLREADETLERAILDKGRIEHRLQPDYHGDPLRGGARILVFREYGRDIITRLLRAGFADAYFASMPDIPWVPARVVIVARKAGDSHREN